MPGLGADLAISLEVSVGLALADGLAMMGAVRLSADEVFFRPYSPLFLSPAAYVLLFLLAAGLGVGLAVGFLQRHLIQAEGASRSLISALLALGGVSLILCRFRAETFNEFPTLGRYLTGLGIAAIVYVFLAISISARSRLGSFGTSSPRSGLTSAVLSTLLAAAILAGPAVQQVLLPGRPRPERSGRRPNVLILMLDTVRADALSCISPTGGRTPSLDAIAREGILFRKALSPAPWTVPSHGSLFTGLYPSQHGAVWEHPSLDRSLRTLAEVFYEKGYATTALSENPSICVFQGFNQGFDEFTDMYLNLRRAMVPGLVDGLLASSFGRPKTMEYTRDSTAQFTRWLRGHALRDDAPPFFAFLNFMAGHLPDYARPEFNESSPPREVVRRVERISERGYRFYLPSFEPQPGDMGILRMYYRGDVSYLDARLGLLFDFLRTKNLLDETIVVVVSDHGENFGEHGLIEHSFNLYNTVLHVPLLIRFPRRIPAGRVEEGSVSTLRLFDTILDLAGVERGGAGSLQGNDRRSLLGPVPDTEIYAEVENLVGMLRLQLAGEPQAASFDFSPFDKSLECLYAGGRKLIRSSNGSVELYDTVDDWAETKNLAALEPARVSLLVRKLEGWRKGLVRPRIDLSPRPPDRSLKDALESLGYIR